MPKYSIRSVDVVRYSAPLSLFILLVRWTNTIGGEISIEISRPLALRTYRSNIITIFYGIRKVLAFGALYKSCALQNKNVSNKLHTTQRINHSFKVLVWF